MPLAMPHPPARIAKSHPSTRHDPKAAAVSTPAGLIVKEPRPGVYDFKLAPTAVPPPSTGTLERERIQSQRRADARLAQERVQDFIVAAIARDRVTAGLDPMWRDLERNIQNRFHPTAALVRVGSSPMTRQQRVRTHGLSLVAQILLSPQRAAQGPLPRGEFAERGPAGEPEDPYRNGLAAQQSRAVLDAWEEPATWRRTEVELIVTATGQVESVRVVRPCGSAKLDQLAVDTIEQAARSSSEISPGKRTVTRWAAESAYAANPPYLVGFQFDATGRIMTDTRGLGRYLTEPLYLLGGNVQRKVTLVSLLELSS